MSDVTPEDVLRLKAPTKGFMCPLNANSYGIDFLSFVIKDYETKRSIFKVSKEDREASFSQMDFSSLTEEQYRTIKYDFNVDVLRTPTISTTLTFAVGDNEVEDFRMIERHYFRDRLIKSYDFTFGFCIPCSTNTWEAVYAVPMLDDALVDEMLENDYDTRSDTFYFVNDRLIMHNKASYKYHVEGAQSKGGQAKAAKKAKETMKYAAKMSGRNNAIPVAAEAKRGAKTAY